MDDIAPSIISRLPPDALIALANTTSASITSKADDIWNKKVVEMGYSPVPCAQGFYFCVNKVGNEHVIAIQRMIAGGVVAHLVAYFRKHPKAYKKLDQSTCYSALTYDELSPEMVEFLTLHIKKIWEVKDEIIETHHILWIITLSFWDEDSISGVIQDDTNIGESIDRSIVPVALHYGEWPGEEVWSAYLPQILLQYPGFFQTGKMKDATGWVDYDRDSFPTNLEDINDELEALAQQDYDKYSKAYLYLLTITGNRADANSYIADFAKEIVMENPKDMIHLIGYYYDEKIFTTLLAAIRRYDVFEKWIMTIIGAESYYEDNEGRITNFFDLPQNKLTPKEMDYVRSHVDDIIPFSRKMLGL